MSDDDKRINDESSGSDSSDDDDVRAVDTTNVDAGLFSSDEDEDGSDAGVQQENVKYVDEHVVIPFADRPERSSVDPSKFEMLVAHLPATIDVIPEPFAKDQYDKDAEEKLLAERNKSFAAYSLIRHRIDDRTGRVQSNTRLVEYSDGSRVLFVGKEAFHAPVGASTKNSFVALNRRASRGDGSTSLAFEFQGKLQHQLQLKGVKSSAVSTLMNLQVKRRAIESDKTGEAFVPVNQERKILDLRAGTPAQRRTGRRSGGRRRAQTGAWRKDYLEQGAEMSSDDDETSIKAVKRKAALAQRRAAQAGAESSEESSSEEEADISPRRRPPPRKRSEPEASPTSATGAESQTPGSSATGGDDDDSDSAPVKRAKRKATRKFIDSDSDSDSD